MPKTLSEKLQLKDGQTIVVLNVPEGLEDFLEPVPSRVKLINELAEVIDGVVLFVHNTTELSAWAVRVLPAVDGDRLLWIAYPKKSGRIKTDMSRDVGWEPIAAAGYRGVRQVAVDDDWSALRFRKVDYIK